MMLYWEPVYNVVSTHTSAQVQCAHELNFLNSVWLMVQHTSAHNKKVENSQLQIIQLRGDMYGDVWVETGLKVLGK